jgi:hypothetical protein
MSDLWNGIFLLAIGIGLFVWVQVDFAGLVRSTGRLSRWAYVIPSTRIGLSAVSFAFALAGILVLTYHGTRTPFQNVLGIAMCLSVVGGFIHDLVCAASEREP